jgi:IS30 family transposase
MPDYRFGERKELMKKKPNQKHLKISDRILIETSLNENSSIKDIASVLSKDPTSISKEIKKHRVYQEGASGSTKSSCIHVQNCSVINGCERLCDTLCKRKKNCRCHLLCRHYEMRVCKKLNRAPHICNGCERKYNCRLDKYYYRAEIANNEYTEILSSSREGINITKEELHTLDKMISPRILKGQPISHVCSDLKGSLPVTERTIYNYVERGALSIKNIDLARKVKYKPRKKTSGGKKQKDRTYRIGRTYRDFEQYMLEHPDTDVIEMDTVHGKSSEVGPKLLTMLFRRTSIMLIFLVPDITAESVNAVFDALKATLTSEGFKQTFPVFLTDNGSEFMGWLNYLSDENGEILSEIFFCNPNSAYQKGRVEKNHEYIRYIIPKGKSFKHLNEDNMTLMMNHINSTKRPGLKGLSPYEFGMRLLPQKLIEALSLKLVSPDIILLKPELLK